MKREKKHILIASIRITYKKCIAAILAVTVVCLAVGGIGYISNNAVFASTTPEQETKDWGLCFGAEGTQPTGNSSVVEMKKYNSYFMGPDIKKNIYLTFDCGYENGNTPAILDALKKHKASATFFVVGHYLESAPDLVKRMINEGHTIGNHTYHHPNMSKISDATSFTKEINDVENKYKEITGKDMIKYYRPPQGKYNMSNLKMANQLGYKTFFWSLAYVDWNQDKQPTTEEAMNKLTKRIHPGAVVLLHNTSSTNGKILNSLLSKWEEMGYKIEPLANLLVEKETAEISTNK